MEIISKYTISLIIPTLNRPKDLQKCLESIVFQSLPPNEVIIVDQSTNDQTKDIVEKYRQKYEDIIPSFIYVHREEKSSARARNYGIGLATGDIICFTDDDIILDKKYLEKIIQYFDDLKVGGVAGNVLNPVLMTGIKSYLRKFMSRVFLLSDFDGRMTISGFGFPIFEREINKVTQVELYSGYSMNFRRELIIGDQFDEWFVGYSFREDVDVSYRISRKAKLLMVPEARFYHNHSSVNRLDVANLKRMQFQNFYYLFKKFRPQTFLYKFLFFYSLSGILLIDLIAVLLGFNKDKLEEFKADIVGFKSLWCEK